MADGLRVPHAIGDFLILRAIRESGGTAVAVADASMIQGMLEIGRHEGVSAAPEAEVLYHSGMTMADVERAAIEAALRETQGNRRKAAELLGIGERTLYRKLKQYQMV